MTHNQSQTRRVFKSPHTMRRRSYMQHTATTYLSRNKNICLTVLVGIDIQISSQLVYFEFRTSHRQKQHNMAVGATVNGGNSGAIDTRAHLSKLNTIFFRHKQQSSVTYSFKILITVEQQNAFKIWSIICIQTKISPLLVHIYTSSRKIIILLPASKQENVNKPIKIYVFR